MRWWMRVADADVGFTWYPDLDEGMCVWGGGVGIWGLVNGRMQAAILGPLSAAP